jgi:MFS family permease
VLTRALRTRPSSAVAGCALLAACVYGAVALTPSVVLLVLLAALGGLVAGGVLPLVNALLGETVPARIRGEVFGYSATAMSVGGAITPVLATSLVPKWGTAAPFTMVVAVNLMLAAVALRWRWRSADVPGS